MVEIPPDSTLYDKSRPKTQRKSLWLQSLLPSLVVVLTLTTFTQYQVNYALRRELLNYRLIEAIKADNANAVESLLAQGAQSSSQDTDAEPPTQWELLLEGLHMRHRPPSAAPSAIFVVVGQHTHMSVNNADNPRVIRALLEHGANPNERDNMGGTPIGYAAISNHPGAVRELISHGADVNAKDGEGWTALALINHFKFKYTEVIRLLKEAGAK